MKLTNNFNLNEFACPCCGSLPKVTDVFRKFIDMLQKVRDAYGSKLVITSGFRCAKHNKVVGGVSDSPHLKGVAVDVSCTSSIGRLKLLSAALEAGFERIGVASTFIHLDVDSEKGKGIWLYNK